MARLFDDGQSEYLARASVVVSAAPFSVACWVKVDDLTIHHMLLTICDKASNNNRFQFYVEKDANKVRMQAKTDTAQFADSADAVLANVWTHCAGVTSGVASRYAYKDGVPGAENEVSRTPVDMDNTNIGCIDDSTGPRTFISGAVAWLSIWDVALTTAEIAILAKGVHPTQIRPGDLVAFWPLGGRHGRNDTDWWTGGLDMTAYNTPSWVAQPPGLQYPRGIVRTDWAQAG